MSLIDFPLLTVQMYYLHVYNKYHRLELKIFYSSAWVLTELDGEFWITRTC